MELSISKCAVLKSKLNDFEYRLNGNVLPIVDYYRNLGVIFSCQMEFREHATVTAESVSRLCDTIMQTLINGDSHLYLKLCGSVVVLKWTYHAYIQVFCC